MTGSPEPDGARQKREEITILLADDHPVVRVGLQGMLSSQPDFRIVAEAEDGLKAVQLARETEPDVILMDLRMPQMDGVKAIEEIRSHDADARIIVLTTYESDAHILRAIEAGATGYLLKDSPREDLFRAIRNAVRGEPLLAPSVVARLMERVRGSTDDNLSGREIEVLELVARGTSNREIAKQLWISETTVKSHLLHINNKLGATDRTAAVMEAIRRGIISVER